MNDQRNLLILDLDETLIHARQSPLPGGLETLRFGHFHIYCRPYLTEFLNICFNSFSVAVWSSASDDYVNFIVSKIFPDPENLVFVWGASRTTQMRTLPHHWEKYGGDLGEYHTQKRLRKLRKFGWPLNRILIVDDSPEKSAQNYGNVIHPTPFYGDHSDRELIGLARYLDLLKNERQLRRIEKRNWRAQIGSE